LDINPDLFKKLISNEPIDARSPYGHPFILRNYGKFMFNTNKYPINLEYTHAYFRRFIILDFEVIIPDEKQDKNLAKRIISKELSGIFNWVLEGLDRLLKQQQFTESPKAKSLLEEMRLESDSVAQFMAARQYIPSVSEEDKILLKDFRDDYKMYCIEQQILSVSQKEFSSRIKSLKFNIVKGGGGNNYTYVKRNDIAAEFAANSLNNKL
jgi:putative DNA primase/helicase